MGTMDALFDGSDAHLLDIVERLNAQWANLDPCDPYRADVLEAAQEIERLRLRIDTAPAAIMDTRDVLGICAPTEEDFPALYALQGRRVRLVVDDLTPNV